MLIGICYLIYWNNHTNWNMLFIVNSNRDNNYIQNITSVKF